MARLAVKSTFSLDLVTVRALDRISKRWSVSKSEALRRAILMAEQKAHPEASEAVRVLDELQRSLGLTPARVREWTRAALQERRAAAEGRERGVR